MRPEGCWKNRGSDIHILIMLVANSSIPPSQGRFLEQEGFRSRFVAVIYLQIRSKLSRVKSPDGSEGRCSDPIDSNSSPMRPEDCWKNRGSDIHILAPNSMQSSQGRSLEQEGFRSRSVAVIDLQIRSKLSRIKNPDGSEGRC